MNVYACSALSHDPMIKDKPEIGATGHHHPAWLWISIAFAVFLALSVAMAGMFDRMFGKAHEA